MENPVIPITNRVKKIQQQLAEMKKLIEKAEQAQNTSPKKLALTF